MTISSKREVLEEIYKCGSDPGYFIDTYAKIQHPVRGLIPFKTYLYQQDLLKAFTENRFNIVLKARQLGITTVAAGFIAWFLLFHKDKNVLIVATKQEVAKNMIRVIKNVLKYLPNWLMLCKTDIDNRTSIELSNGSRCKAVTTTTDVGRSEAVSLLVIDEVAHIKNMEEIWVGLWPTVSTGGRVLLFSTPNGTGNQFHKLYEQAQNNQNNFNCRYGTYVNPVNPAEVYSDRLMWWVHPEHTQAWMEHETAGKSPREVAQEYLCSFNASGDTFILSEDILRLETQARDPIAREYVDHNLWIWKRPIPGAMYLIAADISRGDARDYSAFHVVRLDGILEQVAEYKGKVTPDHLGSLLMEVSKVYNNAIIAPENNSGWAGQATNKIKEAGYPFLYYPTKNRMGYQDPYYAMANDLLPGYAVTSANRLPMLAKTEEYVRMQHILLYSSRLVSELKTFVWNHSRPEAQRGYNDDLIMALAGAIWVREESFMAAYRNSDIASSMIDAITTSKTTTVQYKDFNFQNNFYDRAKIKEHIQNQNKIVMGNGDILDLNWLIKG